jgi:predicted glycosyltransferase
VRILCHAQHLTGVGHAVLPRVLADELASVHDVVLVSGGPAVPRPAGTPGAASPRLVRIPFVQRGDDGALVGERGEPGASVLAQRAELLVELARDFRPDVVMIDHYPFSKWELASEVSALLAAARASNSAVRVVASLRDLAPPTRYEAVTEAEYAARVIGPLGDEFDALLIHSDPAFARLEDFFAAAAAVPVPVTYTGFVVEPVPEDFPECEVPYAVVSTGGIDSPAFLGAAIEAFIGLPAGRHDPMPLNVFGAFAANGRELAELAAVGQGKPVLVHAFSSDFSAMLHTAALSVSRCGYNTSTALLRSRVPAVVVPAPGIRDQSMRAALLAQHGLAVAVESDLDRDVGALRTAMESALEGPRPAHDLDLDGARTTRRALEDLAGPQA